MEPQVKFAAATDFPQDIVALGKLCSDLATQVSSKLSETGHPQPSFAADGPSVFPILDQDFENKRNQLREASKMLYELTTNPEDLVTRELWAKVHDINAFSYIVKYKLAEHVPINGKISYTQLAQKASTGHGLTRKMLRHLMTLRVFAEPEPETVKHTAASKLLLDRGTFLNTKFISHDTFQTAAVHLKALEKWGHETRAPNETAHNIAHNSDKPFFEWLRDEPKGAQDFADLMAYLFKSSARGHTSLLESYDWNKLGKITMVDVGGSSGHCSIAIAKVNPDMTFIVQDLPNIAAQSSDPATTIVPPELRDRITFQGHDMLEEQPVLADAYFMRMVLHDWPDDFCVKALANIAKAMARRQGSRLYIVDSVLPAPSELLTVLERPMRVADLQMTIIHNGMERQLDEWDALFRRGHQALAIQRVVRMPQSPHAIIELQLDEKLL